MTRAEKASMEGRIDRLATLAEGDEIDVADVDNLAVVMAFARASLVAFTEAKPTGEARVKCPVCDGSGFHGPRDSFCGTCGGLGTAPASEARPCGWCPDCVEQNGKCCGRPVPPLEVPRGP